MPKSTKKYQQECEEAHRNFKRRRNLAKEIPDCNFDTEILLPTPPPANKIANYGLPKKERKFPYYDVNFIKNMKHKQGVAFRKGEWERRLNGFWFYNGDKLEYVTGSHYMFLQYWTVEGDVEFEDGTSDVLPRQPDWIDFQRDWHYALDWVVKNPNSFGLLFLGRRRTAKTEMAISEGYWTTTAGKSRKFHVQSKSDDDGKEILKRIVTSWQNMPWIWRPISNGATDFSRVISFKEPTRRDTKIAQSEMKFQDVLNSEIARAGAGETKLDGMRMTRILNDEVFKTPKKIADISKRWDINKKCLQAANSNRISGKAIVTSTVEEVEKEGLTHMIAMWEASQMDTIREETGRTVSGLHALFMPAYYGMAGEYKGIPLIDEWGYSNMKAAKAFLDAERSGLSPQKLIGEKRRNPYTAEEAFYIDSKLEIFSQEALRSQNIYNKDNDVYTNLRRGNFFWIDGRKWGNVGWRDDENGRWLRFIDSPVENRNRRRNSGGQNAPTGTHFFGGCDPVDHGKVRDGIGSKPVSHIIAMPNPTLGITKPTLACQYDFRHHDPNLFYEDMIMQQVYYNAPFLAENQKHGVLNFFKDKGFDGYCMFDPTETDPKRKYKNKGLPTTGSEVRDYLIRIGQAYVNNNVGYFPETDSYGALPFKELIDDLLRFNPAKWTPHDYVVSFLITLCATTTAATTNVTSGSIRNFLPNARRKR